MRIEIKTVETSNKADNVCKAMLADGVSKGIILATLLRVATEQHEAMSVLRKQNKWLALINTENHLSWRNELSDRIKVMLEFLDSNQFEWRRVVEAERKNAAAEGRRPGQTKKRKKASPDYGRLIAALKLVELFVQDLIADGQCRAKRAFPCLVEILPDFIAADELAWRLIRVTDAVFGDSSPEGAKCRRKMAQHVHLPAANAICDLRAHQMNTAQSLDEQREARAKEFDAVHKAVREALLKLTAELAVSEPSATSNQCEVSVLFVHPTVADRRMELTLRAWFSSSSVVNRQDADGVSDLGEEKQCLDFVITICDQYRFGGLTKSPSSGSSIILHRAKMRVAHNSGDDKYLVLETGRMIASLSVLVEKRDMLNDKSE